MEIITTIVVTLVIDGLIIGGLVAERLWDHHNRAVQRAQTIRELQQFKMRGQKLRAKQQLDRSREMLVKYAEETENPNDRVANYQQLQGEHLLRVKEFANKIDAIVTENERVAARCKAKLQQELINRNEQL